MNNEENELLKLYEQQYTGRLFEKAVSYLNERNALFDERDELNKEIERLNNIIDGIETYCNIAIGMNFNMNNNELQNQIVEDYTKMLDKLEELKGE